MKNSSKIIYVVAFLLQSITTGYTQTIYKSWFSETSNVCLKINETGYSTLCNLDNMIFRYNSKKQQLKMYHVWNYPQKNGKDVYVYQVEKLTNDSLVLVQNAEKRLFEYMGDQEKLIFVSSPTGCDSLWIRYDKHLKPSNQK